MSYLDNVGLQSLWGRTGEVFARKTEAAGSMSLSGTTLYLVAVSGGTLTSINLGSTFATDQELANVKSELQSAISSATSGSMSASTANGRFGNSLGKSGDTLMLYNYNGTVISTVTL